MTGLLDYNAKWDERFSWASAMFFIASAANASIKNVFYIPTGLGSALSILAGLVILGSYALCWKVLQKRAVSLFWRSVVFFVFVYLLSAVLITIQGDPLDLMLNGTASLTFAWWIPTGVLACSVIDKNILYRTWVKASYIISAFCLLIFVFHRPLENAEGASEYNMFYGFTIIIPLLIQIVEYGRNRNIYLLLLVLVEIGSIFLFASRGVLLSLFFFAAYKFAFESDSRIRKIIAFLLLILVLYVMTQSIQSIAETIVEVLAAFDIQSRTFEALATGVIDDTSGRDSIWKLCIRMIEERPFFGWGLGGEYYHISRAITGTTEGLTAEAWHPHNGILQNFVCFGVIGGLLANILCLYPLLHLKRNKDKNAHDLLVVFASAAVIPMCVSSANFFTTPAVAIYLYLFYYNKFSQKARFERRINK